jgi:hypothetical protein
MLIRWWLTRGRCWQGWCSDFWQRREDIPVGGRGLLAFCGLWNISARRTNLLPKGWMNLFIPLSTFHTHIRVLYELETVTLGFEFSASCLLDRRYSAWSTPQPNNVISFPTSEFCQGTHLDFLVLFMWSPQTSLVLLSLLYKVEYIECKTNQFGPFKVYNSMLLSIFPVFCNHPYYLAPELFNHFKRKPCTYGAITPHPFALTSALVTTNLFSVSVGLPVLDLLYKWSHIIRSLLALAFFT